MKKIAIGFAWHTMPLYTFWGIWRFLLDLDYTWQFWVFYLAVAAASVIVRAGVELRTEEQEL
jgi:hypothetical protein